MPIVHQAWNNTIGRERVTKLFHSTFAMSPDQVCAAPGRVNLIGEHTDYNAGLCLPIALEHRTFIAFRKRNDSVVRLKSAQIEEIWEGDLTEVSPGSAVSSSWAAYVAGVAWALGLNTGFDAAIDSCVPFGAGLSSSAAIECAVGMALTGADTLEARKSLAQACIRAENEIAGAPTGGLDQSASLLCNAGAALLLDCETWETQEIPLDLAAAQLALLVIDTRAPHALVDGQYAQRRTACERAAKLLEVPSLRHASAGAVQALPTELRKRATHVVSEIGRVESVVSLLREAQKADSRGTDAPQDAGTAGLRRVAPEIGSLFTASHVSLRDDYEVSCPELDTAVEAALSAGAHGARMTGGGFGGSAIALVDVDSVPATIEAIDKAFTAAQFNQPQFMVTSAASGAERIR